MTHTGLTFLLLFGMWSSSSGQTANSPGVEPFSTQTGSAYDTVNLSSSSIIFTLPIRSKSGPISFSFALRGIPSLSIVGGTYVYWSLPTVGYLGPFELITGASVQDVTSLSSPVSYTCEVSYGVNDTYFQYNSISIVDGTGAGHVIPASLSYNPCSNTYSSPLGSVYQTQDGSGYTAILTAIGAQSPPTFTIYDKSGNRQTGVSSSGGRGTGSVTTPNGLTVNEMRSSSGTAVQGTLNDQYGDPLGSTVLTSVINNQGNGTKFSYQDSSGNTQTAYLSFTAMTFGTNFGCPNGPLDGNSFAVNLPTELSLPDGRAFTIAYEPTPGSSGKTTGRIASITLPTGGSISYSYTGGNNNSGIYCDQYGGIANEGMSPTVPVLSRTINDARGNQSVWTYTFSDVPNPYKASTTTVVDPAGNATVYQFFSGYQTEQQIYQGPVSAGNLLKTVVTCYNGNFTNCGLLTAAPGLQGGPITQTDVYTSLNNGSSSLIETIFGNYGLPAEIKQYDYGAAMPPKGNPLIDVKETYGSWNGSSCTMSTNYVNDRLCEKTVYNSSQVIVSDQRNAYDINGNLTQTASLTSGGNYVTQSSTYNANGSIKTSTDGNQNITTYTEGACNGLLPTQISKGGLSVQQQWDCNGDVPSSTTDPNGNATKYTYNDPFYRPTLVSYPDGGSTSTCYSDVGGSSCIKQRVDNFVSTTVAASPSSSRTFFVESDGLGRVVKTEGPNNAVVNTTYDAVGNVSSVSNPYLTTSDQSYGVTSYKRDALGRVLDQCQPDNSPVGSTTCSPSNSYQQYSYSANQTTFTDEAGNSWLRVADGLGRLSSVTEPGGLKTSYIYNALNDLTNVTQNGKTGETPRSRLFTYDGVGRLITSNEPESVLTCYGIWSGSAVGSGMCQNGYDGNGNLLAKTDARGVTVSYHYDALDRLLWKTYPSGTASSCYQYDLSSLVSSGGNLIGRLTNSWTQSTACPPPSSPPSFQSHLILTRRSVLAYDPIGRVLSEQQCTISNCAISTPYAPAYDYDLAGNVVHHSNGIGSLSFTNCYNAAGQLALIVAIGTPCSAPSYPSSAKLFSAPSYNAAGGLTNATFGTGLTLTRSYDNRLRVVSEMDTGNNDGLSGGTATITVTGVEQVH